MSSRSSCASCEKKEMNGIFKCEGCSQTFCLKHTNEHRSLLDDQLNEIIQDHESVFHIFKENKQQSSIVVEYVNQWERDSISKIKQTAQGLRVQLLREADLQKEQAKKKFNQISKQLERARDDQQYLEEDLHRWAISLEQLKYDLTSLSPSIVLREEPYAAFVNKIVVCKENQQGILNETLVSDSRHIHFDDQQHIAMHCGPHRTPAYISGTEEYSSGQHQIRLFISKKTNDFILSFNIRSKAMETSESLPLSEFLAYGWQSDDCVNPSRYYSAKEPYSPDLRGKMKFHLELLIDCDNSKISYLNEKTKRRREIDVDLSKCPLPWKLHFYLYDIGDCVRILSASHLSSNNTAES